MIIQDGKKGRNIYNYFLSELMIEHRANNFLSVIMILEKQGKEYEWVKNEFMDIYGMAAKV